MNVFKVFTKMNEKLPFGFGLGLQGRVVQSPIKLTQD